MVKQAENGSRRSFPFVPYRSLVTSLDHLHEVTVPNVIQKSLFSKSFSGGTIAQLMRAYRDLHLMDDDGKPNRTRLEPLVNPDTRDKALKQILLEEYKDLIGLPLATADYGQVKRWFDTLGLDADTTRKAMTFFTHAATAAGIELHKTLSGKKRTRGPNKNKKDKAAKAGGEPRPPHTPTRELIDTGLLGRLPAPLRSWLEELPALDAEWSPSDFDQWLDIFTKMLTRYYRVQNR